MPDLPRELRTERLYLRRWRPEDRAPFAVMNADPRVMEFFPDVLSRHQSDELADGIGRNFERQRYGLWAVEIPGVTEFAGFIGLAVPRFEAPFTPCVEIGWRLAAPYWGRGYATEGARAAADFAFGPLALGEILSFTTVANARSRRVMEKLGMSHTSADNFDHPAFAADHPLRRHVLYRLAAPRR